MRPPSVDKLARSLADTGLPHPLLVDIAREAISAGDPDRAAALAESLAQSFLQPVINATGVLLHTNMGRSPYGTRQDSTYTNLELDLATGQRGSRQTHAAQLLARLCETESAMVVNNCAAAVTLVLAALAKDHGVAVSRSELVEIGGGFRVPDVISQSGARLVEVGTTNRTRLTDYEHAAADDSADIALALKVHQSNYRIVGFTESVSVAELVGLGVPVIADIGSGLLDSACPWLENGPPGWLQNEPAAKQTLAAGADLVTFSGDKLLGGPQAGIIAGRADLVELCSRHPLARAFRPGGLTLAALQSLAMDYLRRDGQAIPLWRMATLTAEEVAVRAVALDVGEVVPAAAVPGGGTLPGIEIPSAAVAIPGDHTAALRHTSAADRPIVARVADGVTLIDLRTVDPDDDPQVAVAIRALTN
jgi:L-seryl-tRNA(Ser) seleniumtransferase